MLTLNVPVGKTVSIGQTHSLKLISLSSDEDGRDVALVRHNEVGCHPENQRIKIGTSYQLTDNVIVYFNRSMFGGTGHLGRFSFDAPRDVYIKNNWGRHKRVDFKKLNNKELIDYAKTWGKSGLEDELANRLEGYLK